LPSAQVLKTSPHLDPARVAACGGSHGGFLSLHLVGQYGDLFKAAAVRNPVTNIATMYVLFA
jgi:acylaminoacyl-peptidase